MYVLVAGHVKSSPGAVISAPGSCVTGVSELDFNNRLVDLVRGTPNLMVIKHLDIKSYDDRISALKSYLYALNNILVDRGDIIEGILEMHFNSAESVRVNQGWEILIGDAGHEHSAHVANVLKGHFAFTDTGSNTNFRGVKSRSVDARGGRFLNDLGYPSIIFEPFFGSENVLDLSQLLTDVCSSVIKLSESPF